MLTKDQVVKFLIKTDLEMQNVDKGLTGEGIKALIGLCYDEEIKGITMEDIIRWIREL